MCICVSFAVCSFCCKRVISRCGTETELSPVAAAEIPHLAGTLAPNRASVFTMQMFIYLETGRHPRQKSLGTGL